MRLALSFAILLGLGCSDGSGDSRPVGSLDSAAMSSCSVASSAPVDVAASATEEGASAAQIAFGETMYRITLPESGPAYAMLTLAVPHSDIALFTSHRDALENLSVVGLTSGLQHGVCPDVFDADHRMHLHDEDTYMLTFGEDAPREIMLVALIASSGHGDPDAGHHHGEDAGHHHGEDAGHHHGEDAGHHHGEDAGHHHGEDAGHHHGEDAGHHHGEDAGHHHGEDAGHHHGEDAGHHHGEDAG
ncbi:MAG: hypothetical protein AAGE52_00305 [Myxococcota bacterium]